MQSLLSLLLAAVALLGGCQISGPAVSGKISFPAEPALPAGATLTVQLRDVSWQDAASVLIAEQAIADPAPGGTRFEVRYNPDDIEPRNTYGLQAKITDSDGRLLFINDTAYDVITRGNPRSVDLELVVVGR